LAAQAARERYDLVVAAGGDGTVSAVAEGRLHTDIAPAVAAFCGDRAWSPSAGTAYLYRSGTAIPDRERGAADNASSGE
jgi:hypothetical protein